MKRLTALLCALLFLFSMVACSKAPEPAAETPMPTATATATPAPTEAPTPEPTPSPTPEPAFVQTALSEQLFARERVIVTATGIRFSANYAAYIDLSIENASEQAVSLLLNGLYLNDWRVQGALENADSIQPGETRVSSITVLWTDDPTAVYMDISRIVSCACGLTLTKDGDGDVIAAQKVVRFSVPDAEPLPSPAEGATAVYEDNNLIVYLQGIDQSLALTRVILYKKPDAKWASATIDPVYAGYTNQVNGTYPLDAGMYQFLLFDGTDVMTSRNITSLSELDLYISLNMADGRINRPVIAAITDPNVAETTVAAPDPGPIVYQSELEYCILKYMGLITFEGHEAILLDFENVSQNYIKKLDMTAFGAIQTITVDGVDYPLGIYCTYAFPTTHGYIMLWPEGAPEGTLSNAASASARLKIARINAGRLDPIQDTGTFTVDLKSK